MMPVLPAIIPYSKPELVAWLKSVDYATMVQVDIVDGVFAQPASWPFRSGELPDFSSIPPERVMLDMMVQNGADYFLSHHDQLQHVAELVIHLDSLDNKEVLIAVREMYAGKLLLAIMNSTAKDTYEPFLPLCDGVQVMGIAEIGKQGQDFVPDTVTTVRQLRSLHPALDIVVDGSVNKETVEDLVHAGVSRVVVGSALKNANEPQQEYQKLTNFFGE